MRKIEFETSDGRPMGRISGGAYRGAQSAELTLQEGEIYLVEPPNPQKKRHRGRLCVFLGFIADHDGRGPGKLRVRFLDNGRPGRVDVDDLVPAPSGADDSAKTATEETVSGAGRDEAQE